MPRLVVSVLVVVLVITGALLAWPQVRGWWLYQRAPARIIDVLPTHLDGGLVRLSILYEYELPRPIGQRERHFQMGWQVGDAYFRPMPDPVVEAGRVDQAVRGLLDADQPDRRWRTVFFAANDPVGTAFILDETAAVPANRLQIGVVLIGIALLFGIYRWRRSAL
jgi:hypothetical protein